MKKTLFICLLAASLFLSSSLALFAGIVYALVLGNPLQGFTKKASKYLLQISVVGLGFGMNLHKSLETGREGMIFTIVSVVGVMVIGYFIGKMMKLPSKLACLISSGTAICGGSAIAAISPVTNSDENETSISLAVIFMLNAIALFVFPMLGHWFELSQQQFGIWAAIAIHDTSSVVGAGSAYGNDALAIATTVKLTRALWIIPLALVLTLIFRQSKSKITIPWFIFLFIIAMTINTYLPVPEILSKGISIFSHKALSVTLFLIGSTLSVNAIRKVGVRPVIFGIILWVLISVTTLIVILY